MLNKEQLVRIAEWAELNWQEYSSTQIKVFKNDSWTLIEFDPEGDWNQLKELEDKMCEKLKADKKVIKSGFVEYFADEMLVRRGRGATEQEAVMSALLKQIGIEILILKELGNNELEKK